MALVAQQMNPITVNPVDDSEKPSALEAQPDQFVENRIEKIIDKNSPLMQQAAQRGLSSMAPRGLMNSSMAIGAAQASVMDRAAPIASQDAATAGREQVANLEKDRMEFGANLDMQLTNRRADINAEAAERQQGWNVENAERQQGFSLQNTTINSAQRFQEMAATEIAAINQTPGLSPAQQQGAIADVNARLNENMSFMQAASRASPQWNDLFDDLPAIDLTIGGGALGESAEAAAIAAEAGATQESVDAAVARAMEGMITGYDQNGNPIYNGTGQQWYADMIGEVNDPMGGFIDGEPYGGWDSDDAMSGMGF